MPTLANSHVAPPKSWDEFEDIVCSVAKIRWGNPDFTRHGRQGQKQDGVDIYGKNEKGQWIGVQCKNTWSGLTDNSIEEEISKAEAFKPAISMLYIATTSATDKSIQKFTRSISDKRQAMTQFGVEVLFWNDLWNDLTKDADRVYQHFPHLRPAVVTGYQQLSHDQLLFREFQSVLGFEPAIRLLREHDFGAPFRRRAIQPLFDLVETWGQPEKEFIDQELQTALADLYRAACTMSSHLVGKTVPISNGEFASVFSDTLRNEGPRPEWIKEEERELNKQASLFVPIYEQFVRLCRSKLFR